MRGLVLLLFAGLALTAIAQDANATAETGIEVASYYRWQTTDIAYAVSMHSGEPCTVACFAPQDPCEVTCAFETFRARCQPGGGCVRALYVGDAEQFLEGAWWTMFGIWVYLTLSTLLGSYMIAKCCVWMIFCPFRTIDSCLEDISDTIDRKYPPAKDKDVEK